MSAGTGVRPQRGRGLTPFCWGLTPVLILLAAFAHAADAPLYSSIPPTADGIGKLYMGREIAHVMSYHGADWLERPERAREERPDRVIATLDLKTGMAVADIGTGTGYYARRLAERVGS